MKLIPFEWRGEKGIYFFCPGCKHSHCFEVPRWSFDGNMEQPTFSPSLLVYYEKPPDNQRVTLCHLFLKAGKLEFLSDCQHDLKGQTVELPDWPDGYAKPGERI